MKILILAFILITTTFSQSDRQNSIEHQLTTLFFKISNKTIAMLTNPTSVDSNMRPLFDRLLQYKEVYNITIKCFFAPEHGLRGDRQDGRGDDDYIDE